MRRTIQGTILRSSFVIYPITKVGSFLNQKLHTSFSPSHRFFHFFPSWNIDLRARPWALWNFLRSTSPLTHRCRNIIPPARYFNLALSTRQGPEKKKTPSFLFLSLSLPFFLFSHSLHFPRKAGCVRFFKNVASRNMDGKWKQFSSWSDVARAYVCVCVWKSRDGYVRGIVSSRKVHRYFGITFNWKTHR